MCFIISAWQNLQSDRRILLRSLFRIGWTVKAMITLGAFNNGAYETFFEKHQQYQRGN